MLLVHAAEVGNKEGLLGVGLALVLITAVQSVGTVLIYIGLALFLALGLDPIVQWLVARKLSRTLAVILVHPAVPEAGW